MWKYKQLQDNERWWMTNKTNDDKSILEIIAHSLVELDMRQYEILTFDNTEEKYQRMTIEQDSGFS